MNNNDNNDKKNSLLRDSDTLRFHPIRVIALTRYTVKEHVPIVFLRMRAFPLVSCVRAIKSCSYGGGDYVSIKCQPIRQ
jgi:hypothetical protein